MHLSAHHGPPENQKHSVAATLKASAVDCNCINQLSQGTRAKTTAVKGPLIQIHPREKALITTQDSYGTVPAPKHTVLLIMLGTLFALAAKLSHGNPPLIKVLTEQDTYYVQKLQDIHKPDKREKHVC